MYMRYEVVRVEIKCTSLVDWWIDVVGFLVFGLGQLSISQSPTIKIRFDVGSD